MREVQLEILGVVLSLLKWTMLLREGSVRQLHGLLWLCVTTTARVVPSRTKRLLGVVGRAHHTAVILHRCLVLDTVLSNLLHCSWRIQVGGNWSHTLKSAASVNESRTNESHLRMLHACPILGIAMHVPSSNYPVSKFTKAKCASC